MTRWLWALLTLSPAAPLEADRGTLPTLLLYSAVIVVSAVAGAAVPLRVNQPRRLATFLAFAAGVMFGAAFFHMMPEAFHGGGYASFTWLPVGFVFLFLLEHYVLVHACGDVEHGHHHMGLTAFLGLSVHTLFDGVALGSAVTEGVGLMAFLAIAAHKVPSSLSLAAILHAERRSHAQVLLLAALYGLMVPLGALVYLGVRAVLPFESLAPKALAFSAGTFLYIAVSDLLPRVRRDGKEGRVLHIMGLLLGLALMFALTALTRGQHAH
jgi:zinc and cadmium transporter